MVGPEGEVEASVPPEAVEESRVGTDAEKEPVVLILAVVRQSGSQKLGCYL